MVTDGKMPQPRPREIEFAGVSGIIVQLSALRAIQGLERAVMFKSYRIKHDKAFDPFVPGFDASEFLAAPSLYKPRHPVPG